MPPDKSPMEVLGLSRGFMEPRVLLTAAELDLFTLLADQPLSADEAATRQGWHARPLAVLLDALTAMGLIRKTDGRYQTPPALVPALSSHSPTSVLPMIMHAVSLWKRWSDLTHIVTVSDGVERTPAAFPEPGALEAFIGAMHVVGSAMADQVAAEIGVQGVKRFLDVGGASGTYTMAFLKADPQLAATLFDRPPVVEMARERLMAAGLLDRVTLFPGDFYHDELPGGHDLVLLSAIIHQNDLEQNVDLYAKCFRALSPGGRIVIRDHVMSPDRTAPRSGALFAINMLVGTPGGGTWTFDEIRAGLEEAGFERIHLMAEGEPMRGLVEAYKPAAE